LRQVVGSVQPPIIRWPSAARMVSMMLLRLQGLEVIQVGGVHTDAM
jgi:hypothetical protein